MVSNCLFDGIPINLINYVVCYQNLECISLFNIEIFIFLISKKIKA